MTAAELVRARLLTLLPVTNLVGPHVYNVNWPQNPTLPSVRVNLITDRRGYHFRGRTGLNVDRVQVDCIAVSKAAADAVLSAVDGNGKGSDATGIDGFTGDVGSHKVDAIFSDKARQPEYTAGEHRQYMVGRDYFVHWRDATS